MMGRSGRDQGQLFYSFNLEEVVPDDHLVRAIAGVQQPPIPLLGVLNGGRAASAATELAGLRRGLGEMGFIEVDYELFVWRQWRITPSVEKWRPRIPHHTPLHPFSPSATFAYNSSFCPDFGSGRCPLRLFRRGFEPCEDART